MLMMLIKNRLGSICNRFTTSTAASPLLAAGLSVTGLCLNLLSSMPAQALTVSNSATFNPVLQVDGDTGITGLSITGLGPSLSNVSLSVTLTKCGSTINGNGSCNASLDLSFNDDIGLNLLSPYGTVSRLIVPNDVFGQVDGATVTWNFQDSFSSTIRGDLLFPPPDQLVGGYYKPVDAFSIFNGENPNGIWKLSYRDTTPIAPLSINSWSIAVTDETGPGPGPSPADVPGPLPLFGLAAAFGWSRLLRKRIRAKRDLGAGS